MASPHEPVNERSRLVARLRAGAHAFRSPEPDRSADLTLHDSLTLAYRMLLDRDPDPTGYAFFSERLAAGTLTMPQLAEELIRSLEFSRRHGDLIVRQPDLREVVTDDFAIMVDANDWAVGQGMVGDGEYEPAVTDFVRSVLKPGGTFVDLGANIGWYSLLAASVVGPTGSVLAVEPNPDNCELIAASAARNGFDNIRVVSAAVADADCWLALETDASNGKVLELGPISSASRPVPCSFAVPTFTLDELLVDDHGGATHVDLVKVDVEGVETRVFVGAERLLRETRPVVVFEWFPEALRTTGAEDPTAPLRVLRKHGYSLSVIGEGAVPGSPGAELSDEQIERVRVSSNRPLLELVAMPPGESGGW